MAPSAAPRTSTSLRPLPLGALGTEPDLRPVSATDRCPINPVSPPTGVHPAYPRPSDPGCEVRHGVVLPAPRQDCALVGPRWKFRCISLRQSPLCPSAGGRSDRVHTNRSFEGQPRRVLAAGDGAARYGDASSGRYRGGSSWRLANGGRVVRWGLGATPPTIWRSTPTPRQESLIR